MITNLKEVAVKFNEGLLGEKEFLGEIIQIVGEKYTNFPDVEKYSGDVDVQELALLLSND